MNDSSSLPVPVARGQISTVAQLAQIPEEEIWLQKQKSARTRRAYRLDVQHFMATLGISTLDVLRRADHKAVIAWERFMREVEGAAAWTIRRRLAALSSLFRHLIDYGGAARNPAREVARPAINRQEGTTLAFSKGQARKLLDLPAEDTISGLRDRTIASCENTLPRWGSIAATQHTRCARRSSRLRWRMARNWRTCKKRLVIAIPARRSYTTGVGTTRKRQRPFLRRIRRKALASDQKRAPYRNRTTKRSRDRCSVDPFDRSGDFLHFRIHRGSTG